MIAPVGWNVYVTLFPDPFPTRRSQVCKCLGSEGAKQRLVKKKNAILREKRQANIWPRESGNDSPSNRSRAQKISTGGWPTKPWLSVPGASCLASHGSAGKYWRICVSRRTCFPRSASAPRATSGSLPASGRMIWRAAARKRVQSSGIAHMRRNGRLLSNSHGKVDENESVFFRKHAVCTRQGLVLLSPKEKGAHYSP